METEKRYKKPKLDIELKGNFICKANRRALEKINEELKKRAQFVDFDTDVLPFISDRHADVLKNYMCNYATVSMQQIADKYNKSQASNTKRVVNAILKEIDEIIQNKPKVQELVDFFGGTDALEDFSLFLTDEEFGVLKNVVLSPNPSARSIYAHKMNKTFSRMNVVYNSIFIKFKTIMQRKAECEKFVKENGGEEFLINEFGHTLNDENFFVLTNFMMDYHYLTEMQSSFENGRPKNYIHYVKKSVMDKLSSYNTRKVEINELIQKAGGTEKVLNEFYLKLTDREKLIFEEQILAYAPLPAAELAEKLGIHQDTVFKTRRKLEARLNSMVEENIKQKS